MPQEKSLPPRFAESSELVEGAFDDEPEGEKADGEGPDGGWSGLMGFNFRVQIFFGKSESFEWELWELWELWEIWEL